MKRQAPRIPMFLCLVLAFTCASQAQVAPGPGIADSTTAQPVSSRTFAFSGSIPGQLDGALSVTFSIYPDQQSATALWTETQVVQITGEKYSVMLGSTSPTGLPQDIFAADQAHWLGVQVNGSEKRFLLVSVPYAMKAVEAERLGGLLPSDYVTVQQLQSALQSAAAPGTSSSTKTTSTGPTGQAAVAGTTPQPATDFTDNNTSEVLLVTQQGTGFAIHAITSSQAEAILAQNDSIGGTALHALATNATGTSIGVLAETASPNGIAGVFNNQTGGKILSLRNNGVEVASVDVNGNLTATGRINGTFSGNGSGLIGIPPEGINATPFNSSGTIVQRDVNGGFSASRINGTFSGDGSGLIGISPEGINATPFNSSGTIVQRDVNGGFSASRINGTFSGDGSGLIGITPAGINATPFNSANTVVQRDFSGGFAASQISAGMFFGDGSGLVNVPISALNASATPVPNSLVLRDSSGGLSAGTIFAGNLLVNAFNGTAIQGSAAGNAVGVQASTQDGIGLWAGTTGTNFRSTSLFLTNSASGKLISGGPGSSTNINETFSVSANGDIGFEGAMTTPYDITGTWIPSSLVKLTSIPGDSGAGTVTLTSPGDTSGAIGIAFGTGTFSRVQVVQSGQFFCNFDGPATSGHYVGISKTTAGDCADIGASYPRDGQQVVGRVLSSFAPGTGRILLFQSELHGNAAGAFSINTGAGLTGGPITGSGTISVADGGITAAKLAPNAVTSANIANGSISSAQLAANAVTSFNIAPNAVTAANIADGTLPPAKIAGTAATLGANSFSGIQSIFGGLVLDGNLHIQALDNSSISMTNSFGPAVQIRETGGPASPAIAIRSDYHGIDTSSNFSFGLFAASVQGVGAHGEGGTRGVEAMSPGSALVATATDPAGAGTPGVFINIGAGKILSGLAGSSEVFNLDTTGNLNSSGTATARAFAGDGSALTNVSATKIGTLAQADIATNAALSAETAARQSAGTTLQSNIDSESTARQAADTTLQSNINAETTARQSDVANVQASIGAESLARQSVEASLLSSLSAETTARQSDVSTLQTNINNVSAADAKLAASNTFTAGTQDFSGAGATLPVRSVLTANTPTACVASKELLIKTDAPAGQQLFICDASGATWNLVGDGAANGVSSFNGRTGSVSPGSGDYSFAQISGSAAASQLPATVAYNNQSNTFTGNQTVNGSVTATSFSGSGSGLTGVNAASLNGIPSNAFAQLHAINTFTSEQAFAASTAVNPSLNIPAGVAPATPLAGDVWNTGSVLQYRDNASATRSLVSTTQSGGLQLLKLTASITPSNVGSQVCTEQSFTVSGITTGDTLLSVLQPSTSSPGINIAIGGFRVSAANTVGIQFCNVSRNNSTPTSGVYTFALMR